jgi:hypothetical protein
MNRWLTGLACFSVFWALTACAKSPAMLDRVFVRNATTSKITDVKIHHEPSAWFGSVNTILPQNSLDIGFANQPVMTRTASVSWCDGDSQKWSLTVELPDHQNAGAEGRPMSLIYIIYSSGRVDAHLLESIKVK